MFSRSGKAAFCPSRLWRVGRRAEGRPSHSPLVVMGMAAVGLAIAFFAGDQKAQAVEPSEACTLHFSNGVVLESVPVARTKAQKAKGLSGTDKVGRGMLFTWEDAEPRVFWMRDTRVPLSVGFFDAEGLLFGVVDMEPETDDYHFSIKPAADALELEAGQFQQYGLIKGVRLLNRTCEPI
ncbi:MAG: DUF192 domain-containing protein [Porticoccaceae bacterium]|mgnify:CR=1 FL=1|nr:DUF192 domain-containing protein [Porticoccaceae bacterium]